MYKLYARRGIKSIGARGQSGVPKWRRRSAQKAGLADLLQYSLIVVSTAPILCIYPFVQKYFIKGVMIGSVKG